MPCTVYLLLMYMGCTISFVMCWPDWTVLYCTVWTAQYLQGQHWTVMDNTATHNHTMQYCTGHLQWHYVVRHCIALHCVTLSCVEHTMWWCMAWQYGWCDIWCSDAIHCTALWCDTLDCTVLWHVTQRTVNSEQWAVYSVRYTVYSVQRAMYGSVSSVQCTVYREQCTADHTEQSQEARVT